LVAINLSVINNLLEREAVGSEGSYNSDGDNDKWAIVSVADNGCGMTPDS
jgi:hypothetical protein